MRDDGSPDPHGATRDEGDASDLAHPRPSRRRSISMPTSGMPGIAEGLVSRRCTALAAGKCAQEARRQVLAEGLQEAAAARRGPLLDHLDEADVVEGVGQLVGAAGRLAVAQDVHVDEHRLTPEPLPRLGADQALHLDVVHVHPIAHGASSRRSLTAGDRGQGQINVDVDLDPDQDGQQKTSGTRAGRPPALGADDLAALRALGLERPGDSLDELPHRFVAATGRQGCAATVRKELQSVGLVRVQPRREEHVGVEAKAPSAPSDAPRYGYQDFHRDAGDGTRYPSSLVDAEWSLAEDLFCT